MGFERNYQVKIPSNQINKRSFSSIASVEHVSQDKLQIDPWFLTGFTDAEGCFLIRIYRDNKLKIGWGVLPIFKITLHQKDKALLEQIKSYFCVGSISKQGTQTFQYSVQSVKDLARIIDHFEKYPLITQKRADYEIFKQVFYLISRNEHLTLPGLQKIVAIKASMNWGLSDELKESFPDQLLTPTPRSLVINQNIEDPNWLAGFTAGEGSFLCTIYKSKTKLGKAVTLCFKLTQHARDEKLIRSLVEYLGCGKVYVYKEVVEFKITKLDDLSEKIIPFFQRTPIKGVKLLDYLDFVKVIELMKNKDHLTRSGLDEISEIQAGMNQRRKFSDPN